MDQFKDIFRHLTADRDLVYLFFAVFSRFEFALKQARYFYVGKDGKEVDATPDWESFANDLNEEFKPEERADLRAAVAYLNNQPPAKQVVYGNKLEWSRLPSRTTANLNVLLADVRRTRNNLFHGGKSGSPPNSDKDRNNELLRSGLQILAACLDLSQQHGQPGQPGQPEQKLYSLSTCFYM
jgi:hypothetical protein